MKLITTIQELRLVRSFHLHRSVRDDWVDALYWLGSTTFSALMPVWFPYLLLTLFSVTPSLRTFTENGEFALISASLVSAALYIVTKESRWNFLRDLFGNLRFPRDANLAFPNQRLFIYVTGLLTFVSAAIYMGALFARTPGVTVTLDVDLVHNLSLILFGVTILISFLITVIENAFTNRPDIPELRRESLDALDQQFEALGEDG